MWRLFPDLKILISRHNIYFYYTFDAFVLFLLFLAKNAIITDAGNIWYAAIQASKKSVKDHDSSHSPAGYVAISSSFVVVLS